MPASSRVGRPPVLGLVARQFSGWSTTGVVRAPLSCVPCHLAARCKGVATLKGSRCARHKLLCAQELATRPLLCARHTELRGSSPTHGRHLPLASACPARDALKRHTKSHPTTVFGGGKLKVQSAVLPRVLAKSGVSATLPRLWPAAPLTVTVQGTRDSI